MPIYGQIGNQTSAPIAAQRWMEATTVRLIDANTLIKEACAEGAYGYVDAKQIADAPTIDAVEVVRCGFCKNAEPYDCTINGTAHRLYECKKDKAAIGYNKVVAKDDFCSCGERKDSDKNG